MILFLTICPALLPQVHKVFFCSKSFVHIGNGGAHNAKADPQSTPANSAVIELSVFNFCFTDTSITEPSLPSNVTNKPFGSSMMVSFEWHEFGFVVLHKKTGLLAPERDVNALVAHLRWLVANPDRWPSMLGAGRIHTEEQYDARNQGKYLASHYQQLALNE